MVRHGGAAAADPSRIGQGWKKKMEATNLRAARETFRERNPLFRVGHTHDGVTVLKVTVVLLTSTDLFVPSIQEQEYVPVVAVAT